MRVRYQTDYFAGGYACGLTIVESAPQTRTIITQRGYSRYNFPYIYHIVTNQFNTEDSNHFIWSGIYGLGLRVLFASKPLETINDQVFICPLDLERYGLVCTPHEYDYKRFPTRNALIAHAIGLWWATAHRTNRHNVWAAMSPEEVLQCNWKDFGTTAPYMEQQPKPKITLKEYLSVKSWHYGSNFVHPFGDDDVLVDEQFVL